LAKYLRFRLNILSMPARTRPTNPKTVPEPARKSGGYGYPRFGYPIYNTGGIGLGLVGRAAY